MEILINELSKDKFEIEIKAEQQSKHFVSLSDVTHLNLSSNKISKKDFHDCHWEAVQKGLVRFFVYG